MNLIRQIAPPFLVTLGSRLLTKRGQLPHLSAEEQKLASMLRAEHERRNIGARANELVIRDGLSLQLHPDSRVAFEYSCYAAPEFVEELDCFIRHTRDRNRLLDIGALHGLFSLVFGVNHPERQVVAVDASPVAFARLLYNIHKNALSNVTPVECALSDAAGSLRMHYEWEHAVAANTAGDDTNLLEVQKKTGDELCESQRFEPDVIKIDVEGHEVKVVKGLSKTIARTRPVVFLELHPSRILEEGDDVNDLVHVLEVAGYSAKRMDSTPVSFAALLDAREDHRVLFVPPSSREQI